MSAESLQRPFRVLSLDGGGMRGTYTATYLSCVASTFARRRNVPALDVGNAFDLIVGTSTGGIIACGLAFGLPPADIASFYRDRGASIFPKRIPNGLLGLPWDLLVRNTRLKQGTAALRAALEAQFAKTTLGEVYARRGIGLSISAVEMTQHRSWVFKTPHLSTTNHRDDGTTLVDVCMASLDEIRQDLRVTPGSCLGRRLASRFQRAQRADCCPWGTSQGPPYKSIRRNACGQAEARHQD